jgi:PBP4 family serine-type D-alanyl-D-alanine carboxypeptidase
VRPGKKAGDPAVVKVTPPTGYMIVRNECKTSEAGATKSVFVDRVRGRNTIRITGTVPLDYKPEGPEEAITMEEPTLFACQTLLEMLRREGIQVKGQPIRGKKPDGAEVVLVHNSPPMSEMLALLNKPSDNLIAECLLKNLGAQLKGKGTAAAGEEVELEFLKKVGADMTAISITDGSGLSRCNHVSPKNLAAVLKYMHKHQHSKFYIDSLPIAGVDGTLKKRMKGTLAEGNVKAKTGYVSRVSSLSGFVTTKSGEPLVFSILMNNHLCRNKEATTVQDKIMELLVKL